MADKILETRIKQKTDTATNWKAKNTILLEGEIGVESDTHRVKIGHNNAGWNNLPYIDNLEKFANYMPLSGGTFTGPINFPNGTALPAKTLKFVCGIDGFADSTKGQMGWQSKSDFLSGYATQTWVNTTKTIDYNNLKNKPTIPSLSGYATQSWVTNSAVAHRARDIDLIQNTTGVPYAAYSLWPSARANRLSFLPASQILIEQSIDGGKTWTDSNFSDSAKIGLFSQTRPNITIPLKNGKKSCDCMTRITITAIRFKNVPENGTCAEKFAAWTKGHTNADGEFVSDNYSSGERYCSLAGMFLWLSSNADKIYCLVEKSTGVNPNTWIKEGENFCTGWSGSNFIKLSNANFGGGSTQYSNYWYRRITFRTATTKDTFNDSELSTKYSTSIQSVSEITVYGPNVWSYSNDLMNTDRLYHWDSNGTAFFPSGINTKGNLVSDANVIAEGVKGTTYIESPIVSGTTIKENGVLLTNKYLGINAKAVDSGKFDGHSTEDFLMKSGGTMTGPITLAHGDGKGILMPTDANINVAGTSATVLGFVGSDYVIGNGAYGTHIRGTNIDIKGGNAGVFLRSVSTNTDYTELKTNATRALFLQPNKTGPVHIGSVPSTTGAQDSSAALIVNGDIKENGTKLTEKYLGINDKAKDSSHADIATKTQKALTVNKVQEGTSTAIGTFNGETALSINIPNDSIVFTDEYQQNSVVLKYIIVNGQAWKVAGNGLSSNLDYEIINEE